MTRVYLSLIFILLASILQCLCEEQDVAIDGTPRIINGSRATTAETRHQVSVRLKQYDIKFGNGHICGGSLISHNKVLTAAHCIYDSDKKRYRKAKDFSIVMGTLIRNIRNSNTIVSDVSLIAYMQTFDLTTMRDDVAVMFLKHGLSPNSYTSAVAPIALSNHTLPIGAVCHISGWGKTENNKMPISLLIANVTIYSHSVCVASYGGSILEGMFCAGELRGGSDSCQGDSGGPLVCDNVLVGIVSWGKDCGKPLFPGVYANVHYYNKWIMSQTSDGQLSAASNWCGLMLGILVTLKFIVL